MGIEVPLGKDVNLKFEILESSDAVLGCRYAVENVAGSDLYLFNRLYHDLRDDGVFDVDPDLVYVDVEDDVLHLSKRIPDLPDGVLAEALIIPCVTMLHSGSRLSETLRLNLPLQRVSPYLRHLSAPVTGFASVSFSLGYVRAIDLGALRIDAVRSIAGPALHIEMTAAQQLIARTAPVKVGAVVPPTKKVCARCGITFPLESNFCTRCGSPLQAE